MEKKPHVLMVPYPLQGHVIPFVHLAIKLASNGFTITFVNTQSVHHQITAKTGQHDIFHEARKSGLDIRYTTVSDGFPIEFDRSVNHDQFMEGILHVFSAHIDHLVAKTLSEEAVAVADDNSDEAQRFNCLISDTFYVWSSMISEKYNLVNVSFWTEPALVFSLYYHMDLLRRNGHFDSIDNRDDTITYIPGVKPIEPKDLMSYLQATDTSTVVHRIILKAFQDVRKADIIICNTVQEIEPKTITALQDKQNLYAIGPIFPTGFTKSIVDTSLWSETDCANWLNTKPDGSVLYVSFGSYAHVTKTDILEIAYGLLRSRVSFVWVVRPDIVSSNDTDFLPVGFEDDIDGRGMIIPWCCQIEVLSHRAIGGFLTHCGWNSILESIWCNVPLLCFPLLTDQFTNRKLVVDDWKIGLNLCDENRVTKEEVSTKIDGMMSGETSDGLRRNVNEMKKMFERTLSMNGSSKRNFDQFCEDIKDKIKEYNLSNYQKNNY